jgi:hypothetical protein
MYRFYDPYGIKLPTRLAVRAQFRYKTAISFSGCVPEIMIKAVKTMRYRCFSNFV